MSIGHFNVSRNSGKLTDAHRFDSLGLDVRDVGYYRGGFGYGLDGRKSFLTRTRDPLKLRRSCRLQVIGL